MKKNFWKVRYDDASDKAAADAAAAEAAKNTPLQKTFTQEDLNKILAKEKRTYEERNQKLINDLKTMQESATMTVQEKEALEARIEDLQKATMTKEELALREQAKAKKQYEDNLKALEGEATSWKSRYTKETIARSILDEAVRNEAYSPAQLVELLGTKSKLVPVLDEAGKPTADFITKISFDDVDKDQKPVTLELTISETLKRMKEIPDRFGNLFKSNVNSGVGGSNNGAGYKPGTVVADPKSWREHRAAILK
jgi:hypothetical protein